MESLRVELFASDRDQHHQKFLDAVAGVTQTYNHAQEKLKLRYEATSKQLRQLQEIHAETTAGQSDQADHFMEMASEIQSLSIQLADAQAQ